MRHGAEDPCFGVKIGDLQTIRKRIVTDYRLALDLYDTACKTPFAPDYIRKVRKMGRLGKKRKPAKC